MPGWFLLREYRYFPEKSVLDFRFRLFPHKLSGDRDLMRIILPWEKPILQQFIWKNFYVVYCQGLVSNPARLLILTAYEIDPGCRTSVVWAIFVSLAKRVPRTSSPPWKREADDSKSFHTNFNHSYPYLRMVPDNLWSTEREQAVTPPQSPSLDSFL